MITTPLNKQVKLFLAIIIISGSFFYLSKSIYHNINELRLYDWNINFTCLVFSIVLLSAGMVMLAYGWCRIINLFKEDIHINRALKIYTISAMGRYIPGKIAMFIGRIFLSEKLGISKRTIILSVLIETLFSTSGALIVIFLLYPFVTHTFLNSKIMYGLIIFLAIGMAVMGLYPNIRQKVMNYARRKLTIDPDLFNIKIATCVKAGIFLFVYYTVTWLIIGMAFLFLVISLSGNAIIRPYYIDTIHSFVLSWFIGFISFITPGGLGVREAAITISMENYLPVYLSSCIAIASRVWFTVGECLGIVITHLLPTGRQDINEE